MAKTASEMLDQQQNEIERLTKENTELKSEVKTLEEMHDSLAEAHAETVRESELTLIELQGFKGKHDAYREVIKWILDGTSGYLDKGQARFR